MPSGHVKWFDPGSNEARIVGRSGREYPADAEQMEARARVADAPVTFKLKTERRVRRAIDVRLHEGMRTSPAHGRVGDLSGARHFNSRGRAALARQRSEVGLDADELNTRVARHWVDALLRGYRSVILQLYAPDCIVHSRTGTEIGHRAIEAAIDRNPLLGSTHHDVQIHGVGSRVRVRWLLSPDDQVRVPISEQRTQTTLRIAHGQIAEQWD